MLKSTEKLNSLCKNAILSTVSSQWRLYMSMYTQYNLVWVLLVWFYPRYISSLLQTAHYQRLFYLFVWTHAPLYRSADFVYEAGSVKSFLQSGPSFWDVPVCFTTKSQWDICYYWHDWSGSCMGAPQSKCTVGGAALKFYIIFLYKVHTWNVSELSELIFDIFREKKF